MIDQLGGSGLAELGGTIGVIGLSRTGVSAATFLRGRGVQVRVVEEFYDDSAMRTAAESLAGAGCEVVTGDAAGSGIEAVSECSLVVASPGVSAHSPILEAVASLDIEVWSEIELAYRHLEERRGLGCDIGLVAVTGTNGKTTVVSMIAACAGRAGMSALACGNIGYPLLDAVIAAESEALLVAEVSSFQLYFTQRFKPDIAVLLNVAPDHMDWHKSMEEYGDTKGKVFDHQSEGDFAVWNAGDIGASSVARSRVCAGVSQIPFSAQSPVANGVWIRDSNVVVGDGKPVLPLSVLKIENRPAVENSLATVAVAAALELPDNVVAIALESFSLPPHRLEFVAESGGVTYVDDSKATNPHAARCAVTSFDSVILIAGGYNKGLDLSETHGFGDDSILSRIAGVVGIGDAADEVLEAFGGTGIHAVKAQDMASAVKLGSEMAKGGDTVLLSPGCASFDAYSNYAERGEDFKAQVLSIIKEETR